MKLGEITVFSYVISTLVICYVFIPQTAQSSSGSRSGISSFISDQAGIVKATFGSSSTGGIGTTS